MCIRDRVETLQQTDVDEEIHREGRDGGCEDNRGMARRVTFAARDIHRVLEQNLAGDKTTDGEENEEAGEPRHRRSSSRAAGWATIIRPITRRAMPAQRRGRMASPRKIQELSGTRMWTALPTGKAIVRGSFRIVASQLKRLTTDAIMPHQT